MRHLLAQAVEHAQESTSADRLQLFGTLLVELRGEFRFPTEELDHAYNAHH